MRTNDRLILSVLALAGVVLVAAPAEARSCFKKAAIGDAISEDSAKFQVDEALLQATDWGAWATWMASGTTPGYSFGRRSYRCKPGGALGWECHGSATLCKL
jgi:hypothetical protein